MHTRFRLLNALLDSAALTIALIVDLTLNIICMVIIAPGPWEKIGFAAIAVVVVLFAVRSWIVGNKFLWAVFALVSFFFDLSFTLIATDVQTQSNAIVITVDNDEEYAYLKRKAENAEKELTGLHKQYHEAMKRETMDQLDIMIAKAERVRNDAEAARAERLSMIESGELNEKAVQRRAVITAEMIFGSIPTAADKGRWLPILVFAFIFAGLQLVMITAANSIRGKPGRRRTAPKRPAAAASAKPTINIDYAMIRRWVQLNWTQYRRGKQLVDGTYQILPKAAFFNIEKLSHAAYNLILKTAADQGVIKKAIDTYVLIEYNEIQATRKIADALSVK